MKPSHACLAALAVVALAPFAPAHDDDPKATAPARPYLGPGWRARGVGERGGPPQAPAFDAHRVALLAWVSLGDLGVTTPGNDCWGYVSASGREYAILGTEQSTEFVEVTDPLNPVHVGGVPGPLGIWRDVKTYGTVAYSVHETDGVGIQVIDLAQIDQGIVTHVRDVEGTDTGYSHNVVINEETGFLYRAGGGPHGLRVYDLKPDPLDPQYVASWDERYVHDAQVVTWSDGRELAFCCGGLNYGWTDTGLTIVDVTDKQAMTVVAQLTHPGAAYSHQGWLAEDRQYFYVGDELDEDGSIFTTTHVYQVGDPDNAGYVASFTNASHAIGHNLYTRDGLLYQANYQSGLRVLDVALDPLDPPEVAWFDTHPESDAADFGGSWSNYPYLPSGVVLLSDRELGLFVLRPDAALGQAHCSPAVPNSTGLPGVLTAEGSPWVAENRVTATAAQLPPGAFASLAVSPARGGAAVLGGGAGPLCIGVPHGLFRDTAGPADGAGSRAFPVDLGALPSAAGATVAAQPGETWMLQVLYLDQGALLATDALALELE